MEIGWGFDSSGRGRGNESCLDALLPDLGLNVFFTDCEALYPKDDVVNFDWVLEEDSPLEVSQSDIGPGSPDQAVNMIPEWAGQFSGVSGDVPWPRSTMIGRSSARRSVCTFQGCSSTFFRSRCDLKIHLTQHSQAVLSRWINGEKQHCSWPSCCSKATFKSKRALQTHLENIHVDPLLCPEPGCVYRHPFRSNYDLKRHVRTVHYGKTELQFQCPFRTCPDFPKTFARRDKWLNHLRAEHDDALCPLTHCSGTKTGALVAHIKAFHGPFECRVGSCANGPASRFAKFELVKHLEFCHAVQNGDIDVAQNAAVQARDHAVKAEDLSGTAGWVDCRVCLEREGVLEGKGEAVFWRGSEC